MAKTREELLALLNGENALENLKKLLESEPLPPVARDVNNHIHTTYSFSPYSPTAAVFFARPTWARPSAWSAAPPSQTPPSATGS